MEYIWKFLGRKEYLKGLKKGSKEDLEVLKKGKKIRSS